MYKERIEEYYNNTFRDHYIGLINKIRTYECPGGIWIMVHDLRKNRESWSHIPDEDIPLFHCSLGWTVLIDQVMYTYFKEDYPKFQSLTRYPKIEIGLTGIHLSPESIFRDYIDKDIAKFFLLDLKQFFKEFKFEEANWDTVLENMLEDKDIQEIIKKEIVEMKKV